MSAPQFRLAPLCMAVSVKDFRAWQGKAQPGERIVYAQGAALDQQRDVVVLARECAEIGTVTLLRRRDPVSGGFEFIAERLAGDAHSPAALSRRPRGAMPDAESDAGRVLAVLMRHANLDLPCPTNADLARALRLKDSDAARYLVGQLAEGGHIRVENRGPSVTRVVTIAATGKRTSAARVAVGKGFSEANAGAGR